MMTSCIEKMSPLEQSLLTCDAFLEAYLESDNPHAIILIACIKARTVIDCEILGEAAAQMLPDQLYQELISITPQRALHIAAMRSCKGVRLAFTVNEWLRSHHDPTVQELRVLELIACEAALDGNTDVTSLIASMYPEFSHSLHLDRMSL